MEEQVREAFRARPHAVDSAPGFIRLDVLALQENSKEIWLLSHWQDRESFEQWHKSHHYRETHAGIPKGLKLAPKSASLTYFDYVAS